LGISGPGSDPGLEGAINHMVHAHLSDGSESIINLYTSTYWLWRSAD